MRKSFFQTLEDMNVNDIASEKVTVSVIPNCLTELTSGKKAIAFKGKMPLDTLQLKDLLTGKKSVYLVVVDTEEFKNTSA